MLRLYVGISAKAQVVVDHYHDNREYAIRMVWVAQEIRGVR